MSYLIDYALNVKGLALFTNDISLILSTFDIGDNNLIIKEYFGSMAGKYLAIK